MSEENDRAEKRSRKSEWLLINDLFSFIKVSFKFLHCVAISLFCKMQVKLFD